MEKTSMKDITLGIAELMKRAGMLDKAIDLAIKHPAVATSVATGTLGAAGGAIQGAAADGSRGAIRGAMLGGTIGAAMGAGGATLLDKRLKAQGSNLSTEVSKLLKKIPHSGS